MMASVDDMTKPDASVASSTDDEDISLPGLVNEVRLAEARHRSQKCRSMMQKQCTGILVLVGTLVVSIILTTVIREDTDYIPANPNLRITNWVSVGETLKGEESEDMFGSSLALSNLGDILAVGAPYNDASSIEGSGSVEVFERDEVGWDQTSKVDELSGSSVNQWFGWSLALSGDGNILASGGDGMHISEDQPGRVQVFKHAEHNSWSQIGQKLVGKSVGDGFGNSISLSDDGRILAVGVPGTYVVGGTAYVSVFAYLDDLDQWVPLGEIMGSSDGFGSAVKLSADGRILAIGAPESKNETGVVHIYEFNSENQFVKRGQDIEGLEAHHRFGSAIDLSSDGKVLAVGEAGAEYGNGLARVFRWDATGGTWDQFGNTLYSEGEYDSFGCAVSLSSDGHTVAVGAYLNDAGSSSSIVEDAGHVRVFAIDYDAQTWQQVGPDIDGIAKDDALGVTVELSADGTILATGGPFKSGMAGHVRLFQAEFD